MGGWHQSNRAFHDLDVQLFLKSEVIVFVSVKRALANLGHFQPGKHDDVNQSLIQWNLLRALKC